MGFVSTPKEEELLNLLSKNQLTQIQGIQNLNKSQAVKTRIFDASINEGQPIELPH